MKKINSEIEIPNMLNELLAMEVGCGLRYRKHYFAANGIHSKSIAQEFLEHAEQEGNHAMQLATRISQLGGEPNFFSPRLMDFQMEMGEFKNVLEILKVDLAFEKDAVIAYREAINMVAQEDPTTRRVLERILEEEEGHVAEISTLLGQDDQSVLYLDPTTGEELDQPDRLIEGQSRAKANSHYSARI